MAADFLEVFSSPAAQEGVAGLVTVLTTNSVFGWIIVGFIVLLTLITRLQLMSLQRRIGRERRSLRTLREGIRSLEPHDLLTVDAIEGWRETLPRDGATLSLLRSFWALRRLAVPDVGAVLTSLSYSERARLDAYRGMPPTLLLLGGVGTLYGLASTLAVGGDTLPLREMQAALTPTLYGVLAALVTLYDLRRTQERQAEMLGELNGLALHTLAPVIFPPTNEAQLDDFQTVLQVAKASLDSMQTVMAGASSTFESAMLKAGSTMNSSVDRLAEAAQTMAISLAELGADVKTGARTLEGSSARLRESAEALAGYHADLRNAHAELHTLFNEAQALTSRQMAENLSTVRNLQTDFGRNAGIIIGRVDAVAHSLTDATRAFKEAGEAYSKVSLQTQGNLGAGFAGLEEGMGRILSLHKQALESNEATLRQMSAELATIAGRLAPELLPHAEWQAAVSSLHNVTVQLQRITEATVTLVKEERAYRTAERARAARVQS